MEVRVATVDDAEAVAAVHVRSWQHAYGGLLPDAYLDALSVERRRDIWSRILAETDLPRTGAFVLQAGLEVIGFIHVAPARDDDLPASTEEVTALTSRQVPGAWVAGAGFWTPPRPASRQSASPQPHHGYWKPISGLGGSTNDRAGRRTGRARSTIEATWSSWRSATARLPRCRSKRLSVPAVARAPQATIRLRASGTRGQLVSCPAAPLAQGDFRTGQRCTPGGIRPRARHRRSASQRLRAPPQASAGR